MVAHTVNVCVWYAEIAKVRLNIGASFGVSLNLTPHFITRHVESLRICFDFLTENKTFKACLGLLNFLDFSG